MDHSTVADLRQLPQSGKTPFRGIFILRSREMKTAKNGNEFIAVEFGDNSGSFRSNCFQDGSIYRAIQSVEPGSIVEVEGESDYFNNNFSPKLNRVTPVDEETASQKGWMDQLVKSSNEDPEKLREELENTLEKISPPELKSTVALVLEEHRDTFHSSSAAISMHHAYRSGLLEHTVRMARCCQSLLPHYPEVHPGLAMAGIILHDIGKVLEYTQGMVTEKTRPGILQGHVVLGYRIVRKAAIQSKLDPDLLERLEHIILSHQGELEWGAAVKAATPEAVFVSMIDNLDAKMGMVQEALRQAPADKEFSDYLPGLGTNLLLKLPGKD